MPVNPPGYYGARVPLCTGIAATITLDRSSGTCTTECPAMVYAHAGVNTTGTGITYPWDEIEYRWDFGDDTSNEVITHPVHGGSVNLDTCQIGPNAAFAYLTAGVKTITCTPRVLRSGSGTVADPWVWMDGTPATTTFTVTSWSGTDRYYDSVAGTPTGAGTIGDPISDEADLRTWLRAGNDRRALIKRGSTFTLTTSWQIAPSTNVTRSGQRIEAYGSGADPIVIAGFTSSGGGMLYWNCNNAAMICTDFVASGIVFDGNNTVKWPIYLLGTTGYIYNVNFYKCTFKNPHSTADGSRLIYGGSDATPGFDSFRFWRSTFDGGTTAEMGTLIEGNGEFYCWVACNFLNGKTGSGIDTVRDHYMYIPKCSHVLVSHCDFHPTGGDYNYCMNIGTTTIGTGGETTDDYVHVVDCDMSGTRNGVDASPTNNNANTGRIGNVLVQRNCAHGLGDMTATSNSNSSFVLYYGARRMTIRRNLVYGCTPTSGNGSSLIRFIEDTSTPPLTGLAFTLNVYENKLHIPSGLGANLTWLQIDDFDNIFPDGVIRDNIIVDERSATRAIRAPFAKLPSMTFDNNLFYSTIDSVPDFINETGSVVQTEAQFEATFGTSAFTVYNTANPNWSSPSTGIFEPRYVRTLGHGDIIEYADNTSVDAYGEPYAVAEVESHTFRLYNGSPNQVLTLTSGGISIAGDATITTNPASSGAVTIMPGDYATLVVLLTTSSAGEKTFTVTVVSNESGTPFLLVNAFTVSGAGGPGADPALCGFFDLLGLTVHYLYGVDSLIVVVRTGRTQVIGGDGQRTLIVGGDGGRTEISHTP